MLVNFVVVTFLFIIWAQNSLLERSYYAMHYYVIECVCCAFIKRKLHSSAFQNGKTTLIEYYKYIFMWEQTRHCIHIPCASTHGIDFIYIFRDMSSFSSPIFPSITKRHNVIFVRASAIYSSYISLLETT